jgi:hypothetical protein
MVNRHIAFIEVEDEDFRDMLLSLNQQVKPYLVQTGDTVRTWAEDEFIRATTQIKQVLAQAVSRIHISFDLWTSPNGYAICGVVAHFVGHQYRNQQVLLALKRMKYNHTERV